MMPHHKLCEGVWYTDFVTAGDRPVLGVAAGKRTTLLIDGGNSPAHARELLSLAESLPIPRPRAVCLTHWHWDHTFGAAHLGLPVIAHEKTGEKMDWMRGLDWSDAALARRVEEGTEIPFCRENILIELPDNHRQVTVAPADILFDGTLTLDLGGITARVIPVACDHTGDCCIIHLLEPSVVFLGDCLYANLDREPWFRTRQRTLPLLEFLLSLEAKWYLPSHHGLYTGEAFRAYVALQKALCAIVGDAVTKEELAPRFERVFGRPPNEDERQELGEFWAGRRILPV